MFAPAEIGRIGNGFPTVNWKPLYYQTYIPASCSLEDDLASLLCSMGFPNRAWNCFSVPRKPGIRKSNNDQSSNTLFWKRISKTLSLNQFIMKKTKKMKVVIAALKGISSASGNGNGRGRHSCCLSSPALFSWSRTEASLRCPSLRARYKTIPSHFFLKIN